MSAVVYVGFAHGYGLHRSHLEPLEYQKYMRSLYAFMLLWAVGVTVVKLSILLFYWRVFIVQEFRRRIAFIGAFVLLSGVTLFFTLAFQCRPVSYFLGTTKNGRCIDQIAFYIAGGVVNIIGDALVWSLPIRQIWQLNVSVSQRVALVLLFGLGIFVCITSIVRLVSLPEINPKDFSYTIVGGGLWSLLEVQVGFICANLPYTRSLAVRCCKRRHPIAMTSKTYRFRNRALDNYCLSSRKLHPNRVGFHCLASEHNTPAKKDFDGFLHCDVEDAGSAIDMGHSLTAGPDQNKSLAGQVEVQTEMRQEVERVPTSRDLRRPDEDEVKAVLTQITAM
ncbi:MAG: hypothetical protein Q9167_002050 [Letrouitia subvulpina]